jgi:hypothetical protein
MMGLLPFFGNGQTIIIGAGSQSGTSSNSATGDPGPAYRSTSTSNYVYSRHHYLYTQTELAAAGITPGSMISEVSWYMDNGAGTNGPADFEIWLKNSSLTTVQAPPQLWSDLTTGATQTYSQPTTIAPTTGWVVFTLTTPFLYTGDALEISTAFDISGGTSPWTTAGFSWKKDPSTNTTISYVNSTPGTTLNNLRTVRPQIRIVYSPSSACTSPPTPGTLTSNQTGAICAGTVVNLSLTGSSYGSGQTYQLEDSTTASGTWASSGASSASPPTTVTPPTTTYYRIAVTCSGVTTYTNAVEVIVNPLFPGGSYTINSAAATGGTNFHSFTDAVNAISCGISGAVVFNVVSGSGPYNEQVIIPSIGGSSSINTVTFNGSGEVLEFASANTNERATIKLDGADNIVLNGLNVVANGTYGFGIHLINDADNNIVQNCNIFTDTISTSTNFSGLAISGSASSATATGSNCDNNLITNNVINGGYYCLTTTSSDNNILSNNVVKNFYYYGIYVNTTTNTQITGNDINRDTRSSVSTFYGIYLTGISSNSLIGSNRIHDPFGGDLSSTSSTYPVYLTGVDATAGAETRIINNAIYNIVGGGLVYAFYNSSSDYALYYHNSVSIDDAGYGGTSSARGFYQTTTATGIDVKNNIFSITRGGSGDNFGIYLASSTTLLTSNNNDFYINGPGNNYTGYAGGNQANLAAWQGTTSQDANSAELDPIYASPTTGDLTPASALLDNLGTPVGVTTDIMGNTRSATTPDIGAYEFSVPPCTGTPVAGTASGPASICTGEDVTLSLTGFTIGQSITIQWEYFDNGASAWTAIPNATSPTFTVSGQLAATDYHAVVTCTNGGGSDISNVVSVGMNSFLNCYCPSNATSASYEDIWNVSVGSLNNTSDCSSGDHMYSDFTTTAAVPDLPQTSTASLSVTIGTCGTTSGTITKAYIDFNQNGLFTDAGEEVWVSPSTTSSASGVVLNGAISVPATAQLGITKMRIVLERTTTATNVNPCGTYTYGETEDYFVNITAPPACDAPGIPMASNVLASGADINWPASVSNPANYEWTVFLQGSGPYGTPVTSGTATGGTTTANVTGLAGNTDYTFYVRSLCTPADSSTWVSVNFTTPCAALAAPWFDDVETQTATSSVLTNCWSSSPTGSSSSYAWNVTGTGTTPSTQTGPNYAHSGSKYFFTEASYGTTNAVAELISPTIDVSALTQPYLQFYYHMYGSTINKLMVSVFDGNVWTDVDSIVGEQQTSETAPWGLKNVVLTGYTGNIQVKFTGVRGTSFYGDLSIDDISIIEAPSCIATGTPIITASQGVNATIEWTQSASAPAGGYYWTVFASGNGPTGTPLMSGTEPAGDTIANITGLTPGTAYTFYVRSVCSATDSSQWASVNFTPSCSNPTGLTINNTTTTGGSASFTPSTSNPAGYEYRVVAAPGTASDPAADNGFLTGSTITMSNLTAATNYTLYVRSICGSGDTATTWVSTTLQTQCVTFMAPYTESFNTSTTPACWTNSGTGNTAWKFSTGAGPGYGVAGATDHTGNGGYFAWVDGSYVTTTTVTLTSPVIDITALTNPRLRYYVISNNTNGVGNNKLVVEALDGANWISIDSIQQNFATSAWNERIFSLSAISSPTTQLRFSFTGLNGTPSGFSAFYNDLLIDDVNIENVPTCIAPTSPTASNITSSGADLAWVENGSATQWSIEYGPQGFTPGTGSFATANSNPFTLSGLNSGTYYSYYVRAICSATDSSFQAGPTDFLVPQIPVTIYPYTQDWETNGTDWTIINGNQPNKWFTGTATANSGTHSLYISDNAGSTNTYTNTTASVVHAFRDLDLSSFTADVPVSFDWRASGESTYDYLRVWIVPMSYIPTAGTQTTATGGNVMLGTNLNLQSSYVTANLNIPASLTGSTVRLILEWRNDGSAGTNPPASVDNLVIGGFPLAIKLKDISATNIGNRNRVDWKTATEAKGDKFEVERSSDGRSFSYLSTIAAAGEPSSYSYWDESPFSGINYYRLRLTDASGHTSYTATVTAFVKAGTFTVEAYPNPVSDVLTVVLHGTAGNNPTLNITDVTGKVVKTITITGNQVTVDMSGIAAGMYLVKYSDDQHTQTIKVNKK